MFEFVGWLLVTCAMVDFGLSVISVLVGWVGTVYLVSWLLRVWLLLVIACVCCLIVRWVLRIVCCYLWLWFVLVVVLFG